MATWPVDEKVVSLKDRVVKPANRKTSAAGYTMSFPKGTIMKRAFTLKIDYITKAEKDIIEQFFDDNQGKAFNLNSPDPNSTDVHSVIFDQDFLEFEYRKFFPGEYTLGLNVKEV